MQSPVVREHAGIPDDQVIMICVAMGFPNEGFPANAVISNRKSVDEAVVFLGFEQVVVGHLVRWSQATEKCS